MSRNMIGLVVAAAMVAGYALSVLTDLLPGWTLLLVLVALFVFSVLVEVLARLAAAYAPARDGR